MQPLAKFNECWRNSCSAQNWHKRFTVMQSESTHVTLLVTQTLERLDIPYAVGGSLASSVHGVMRSTLDVDIVADMNLEHIPPLVATLSKDFYADEGMIREAIEHKTRFK